MSSPHRSDHGLRGPLLLAALALAALVALAAPATTSLDRVPLRGAGDLADSIGVVTHGSYADTPYADGDRVLSALKSLGIRHVRDGVSAGRDERLVRYLQKLGSAGIRFALVTGPPDGSRGSVDQLLAAVRERLRTSVESIEGLNEYDLGGGPDWAARATDYQRELYGKAKADPALRDVPILAPSVGRPADTGALRELRPFADDGNLHLYPGGLPPSAAE
ncbi:MAG: hypothetical protein QOE53_3009, partial [Pseudonocardiales bacterium]|nr:hypothetical protein [Pseudonocardiales bacterium]